MIFIETHIFTEALLEAISDDEYRVFQEAVSINPKLGVLIPGGGGLRKVRWGLSGQGKRGGMRVIYYWVVVKDIIYLLLCYKKNRQENLTTDQLAFLKSLVKGEFK